jgi:hypothetical protein
VALARWAGILDAGGMVTLTWECESHPEDERKWMAIFGPGPGGKTENVDAGAHFRNFRKEKRAKFCRRVMRGIPDSCRARAWSLLLDPNCEGGKREPAFAAMFRNAVPRSDAKIRTDVGRIVGRVGVFTTRDVSESLYRLLRAYVNSDREVDYWPGMGCPAALLISYMNDEDAYWSFRHFMGGSKRCYREFYRNQFTNLNYLTLVWEEVLGARFPKVVANFQKLNIESSYYTGGWFLAGFQGFSLPPELRLRLFDRLCAFGTRTLLSFAILVLAAAQKELETGGFDRVTTILKDPTRVPLLQNWKKAIAKWDGLFLTKKEYERWFTKAGVPFFK